MPEVLRVTPERRETIVLLLGSRNDAVWYPPTWTGSLQARSTLPGPAPSEWRTCPTCQGDGVLKDRFGRETPCETCVDEKGRSKGCVKYDRYTSSTGATVEAASRTIQVCVVTCDRCGGQGVWRFVRCELCGGSGRREMTLEPLRAAHAAGAPRAGSSEVYSDPRWTPDERWRARGSYDALDAALAYLALVSPLARRQVYIVYETGQLREGDLTAPRRGKLELGLRVLDHKLPRRLRVPRSVREAAARRHVNGETAVRIKSLRFEHGLALFELQVRFSLSRAQVLDVLGRTG